MMAARQWVHALREFRRLTDRYYWQTAFMIAQNNITRQYKNSFLGMAWTVLQPLTQVAIFALVMPLIMRFPVQNYVLYLIISYPLWNFFAATLIQSSHSILNQAETLKRCVVSSTVFPIADVLKNLYTYLVSFATMYLFCVLFLAPFDPIVLLLPVYLLPVIAALMALAVAVAFVAPYIRDIGEFTLIGMNVIFWLTPVVYPLEAVPEQVRHWFWLNPFFIMMHPVHELVYYHRLPDAFSTLALLTFSAAAIAAGYAIYRVCRRNYVYYL